MSEQPTAIEYLPEEKAITIVSTQLGGMTVVKGESRVQEADLYAYGPEAAAKIAAAAGDARALEAIK